MAPTTANTMDKMNVSLIPSIEEERVLGSCACEKLPGPMAPIFTKGIVESLHYFCFIFEPEPAL